MQETLLFVDERCLAHDPGYAHPESPGRLRAILDRLDDTPIPGTRFERPRAAIVEELQRVHTIPYVQHILSLAGSTVQLDPDTATCPATLPAALLSAGAAIEAVSAVSAGVSRGAFALGRPPGHHAEPDRAMGFCLFNNVAIAAAHAREVLGYERVLIVDWDVHHGNGTQVAFYDRPEVLFFSTHRLPFYPDTGALAEVGRGAGEGYNVNVPLPPRLEDGDYAAVFRELLVPIADAFKPQLVLVSAGFDPHGDDPLGGMGLSAEGFANLCVIVRDIAQRHAGGRLAMVLEGGYDLPALADSVHACTRVLTGDLPPPPPPPGPRGIEALREAAAFHRRYWPI